MSSLKNKLLILIIALFTVLTFYFWTNITNRWFLFGLAFIYLLFIGLSAFYLRRGLSKRGWGLAVFTALSTLALLSVLENSWLEYLFSVIGVVAVVYFFLNIGEENLPLPERKVRRRWQTFIIVYDFLAVNFLLFALSAFLPGAPFWSWSFVVSFIGAYLAFLFWQEYLPMPREKFFLWMAVFFLLLWELLWTINLLPLGYLVSGVLVVWPWYVGVLLVRFHLTPDGIVWRRQAGFLLVNLILYISLLVFFVKWL